MLQKNDCCGCEACTQVCPPKCIEMKTDSEGFAYPCIDHDRCVNCHMCEKVCPILNQIPDNNALLDVIVAKNNHESRMSSSSGGVFYLLAKHVLDKGGVVFGAAFDSSWYVKHVECNDFSKLDPLLGSKYLQSRNSGSFVQAKKLLTQGTPVLYVGTPCQIAGLRAFLGNEYDNLFLVDILCHGVPSPGVWKKYIDELSDTYNSRIKNISFRDKTTGWHNYSFTVLFEDGNFFSEPYPQNIFMKMFLSNAILRPSCYNCRFKDINRVADITIGDAWGIEDIDPGFDDNKGTSIVLTHSKKGKDLIEAINSRLSLRPIELDTILPSSAASRKSVKMHGGRALLFYYYRHNRPIKKMMLSLEPGIRYKIFRRIIKNK
jgi:coenzyme F420-reducing hydrogenase beta subunit